MKNFNEFSNTDVLTNDFPFVRKFDFATVYSKTKIEDFMFRPLNVDEESQERYNISSGTKIGIVSDYEDDYVDVVIEYIEDGYFWNYDDSMTSDSEVVFELAPNVSFSPASEPVDLIDNDYEGGGGEEVENKKALKKLVKKYGLDNLLLSV